MGTFSSVPCNKIAGSYHRTVGGIQNNIEKDSLVDLYTIGSKKDQVDYYIF